MKAMTLSCCLTISDDVYHNAIRNNSDGSSATPWRRRSFKLDIDIVLIAFIAFEIFRQSILRIDDAFVLP